MNGVTFGVFSLSVVLLFGAIYNLLAIKKPGFYPPKKALKRRALIFASCGAVGILIGILLSLF